MDEKNFVSLETAKKLKDAGFDWTTPPKKIISKKIPRTEREVFDEEEYMYVTLWDIEQTPIPTLWQAEMWLRENGWHVQVMLNGVRTMYFVRVYELVGNGKVIDVHGQFDDYQTALSAGIDSSLDFINNENKQY